MSTVLDVQKAMESDGFFPDSVSADGKINRFKRNKDDKGQSGWYVCHQNHSDKGEVFYVAVFGDWREFGNEFKFITAFTQSKYDRAKIEEQLEKAEKKRKAEQERVWEQTSTECTARWEGFSDNPGVDYLERKKIPGLFGTRSQLDPQSGARALYVPVRDCSGKMWGFQKIQADGQKFFFPGTKKAENFHVVGGSIEHEDIVYLAEGFATAASIHQAISKPVVVCFDAGNLEPVARAIHAQWKEKRFVICGDDDKFAESGNAGRDKAESAARAVLGKAVFPVFESTESLPTDFNDLHVLQGLEAVKNQILGIEPEIYRVLTLGHLNDTYYYISSSNQQIISLARAAHSNRMNLMDIMPQGYWESQYPSPRGVDWDRAGGELMESCRRAGVFQPERVRGVGVWPEKMGQVVNLGNSMWVNDKISALNSFPSRYTYEIGTKMDAPHEEPLQVEDCELLRRALENLRWKKSEFGKFMAGWIVVAPLAGILQWRPHIWLNGPAGSGKSWVMQTVINKMFGENRFYFQGDTTEAGIRQTVGSNARPVIFDEFETDDDKSAERIKSVLQLIRQASSESDGMVVKGGASGRSIQYRIRFACMVASVRVNLIHEQDKTRFTLLDLDRGEPGHFKTVQDGFQAITPEYAARLFSRSVRLVPTILENQARFQAALSEKYNSRFGQQYGTLLAGYGSLLSDEPLQSEEIDGIIESLNFSEESEVVTERDENDLVDYLLKKVVQVDLANLGRSERSVAELIHGALYHPDAAFFVAALARMGIKPEGRSLYIANSHPSLRDIFRGTKWTGGWKKSLMRIANAERCDRVYFGTTQSRCVKIPIDALVQN